MGKKGQQKKTIRNVLKGDKDKDRDWARAGKNHDARWGTALQLHQTGWTISDNMALRTPDFDARTRAAGVTCRSAGRTGFFLFFPKA